MEKLKTSDTFGQGYRTVEAVAAAILDLELHTRADGVFEPKAFEREMPRSHRHAAGDRAPAPVHPLRSPLRE